ncbi:hypothetical protein KKF84_00615 [Myxococcota bacterium]|nr:hypothetical protein [Myxococcota bacterium]MBU1533787.1 hypothetical protein [Myxococcota bacterium]
MKLYPALLMLATLMGLICCGKSSKSSEKSPAVPAVKAGETNPLDLDSLDTSCRIDSDCVVHPTPYKTPEGSCCHSCGYKAVSLKALELHKKTCQKMSSKGCPQKKCAAPPAASCQKGTCTLPQ